MLRFRKRKSTSRGSLPHLRRLSSISVASLDFDYSSRTIGQHEDDDLEFVNDSFLERIRNILRFDAINLKSTAMRNATMLSSLDDHSSVSYIPHYGVDVCFTDEYHSSPSKLEPYRKIGDPEMDLLLSEFPFGPFDDVISAAADAFNDTNSGETNHLAQFYRHYNQVPSWVDFDQIQRGIDVFLAYLPAAGGALYYRSLVGGFSIPKIVEVLKATRYLVSGRKKTLTRLVDTGGLLAACFAPSDSSLSAASLRPGGKGWMAALRVRVLHAKVRRRLLQLKRRGEDGNPVKSFDAEKNGIPINQEDLAATLLAFSVNVLWGIEIFAGKPLPANEQLDYLALWRYIGWLLGIDTPESEHMSSNFDKAAQELTEPLPPIDPCRPSILHSYASLESIILHILHPEPNSCDLVTHLLSVTGFFAFRAEACRKLLGDPLADGLGLPKCHCWQGWRVDAVQVFVVNAFLKLVVYMFFMCFRFYTLLTMSCPWFKMKATVWHGILQRKFLLKWEEGHSTRMSAAYKKDSNTSASAKASSSCPFSMVMPPQI